MPHSIFLSPLSKRRYPWLCGLISGLCFVPWVCVSVSVPVPRGLDDVALSCDLKAGGLPPPAPLLFLRTAVAVRGLFCFHMNCEIFCYSSVKNAIGNLMGIALHL